jgi:hypothetical protein
MSSPDLLPLTVYGEQLDSLTQRSLGYRLLVPAEAQPWCAEVEALARRLQTAPYPEHWPASDLFCSILLADGRRLVAVARYGLADHTPSQRRGGLELIGAVAPAGTDVASALSIYRLLRKRRHETDSPRDVGSEISLSEALALASPTPASNEPLPVVPVRLWQDGAMLFAATGPGDPDQSLRLLEQTGGTAWQWLPLIGSDFPLQAYLHRGPTIAWTPHLAGVAVKLDRKPSEGSGLTAGVRHRVGWLPALGTVCMLLLLGGNLFAVQMILQRMPAEGLVDRAPPPDMVSPEEAADRAAKAADLARTQFAEALYDVFLEQGAQEWKRSDRTLLTRYEPLARSRPALRIPASSPKGRAAVGACGVLAGRSSDGMEETVRKALTGRGFSDKLIDAACDQVRERLATETGTKP